MQGMNATATHIYICGEFVQEAQHLQQAITEAYKAVFLKKKNTCGSGYAIDVYLHRGAGAYICGEETALTESLEGKQGKLHLKPPFTVEVGLFGCPSTVANVENRCRCTNDLQTQFKLVRGLWQGMQSAHCISGHVNNPRVIEKKMSIPLKVSLRTTLGMSVGAGITVTSSLPISSPPEPLLYLR